LALLRVLIAPADQRRRPSVRCTACNGGQAAELLIDLEDDRRLALMVADVLKEDGRW